MAFALATKPAASPVIQTKLKVGAPNDELEQEADRIADQVITTPTRRAGQSVLTHLQHFVGRSSGQMDAAPAGVEKALASRGRPLEPALCQNMEQRFGYDFSGVRVHFGADAGQSARDVNANAYTVGHDIVFGAGRFEPGTHQGRRLIAHELTHVVQQSGSAPAVQRAPKQQPRSRSAGRACRCRSGSGSSPQTHQGTTGGGREIQTRRAQAQG